MNLSGLFIRRPVATTLIMLAIVLSGLVAYRQLPVSDLPNVDFPTISVSASLPGASPETMAAAVATPLEKQFATIAGIDAMTSTSTQGSTQITLTFTLDRDIDAAAQDVQAAISRTLRQLPQDMRTPSFNKVNPADTPILFLAVSSATLPLSTVDEYAQTWLAQRISTVPGVAQAQVFGSQKYAVRIELDPPALASRGIGLDELSAAVDAGNPNLPTGTLWGPHRTWTVRSDGQIQSAAQFASLVIAQRDGAPVRLGDVARVTDSVEDTRNASWFDGRRAVVLAIRRQPGSNTVETAQAVLRRVEEIRPQLPGSIEVEVLNDRSVPIRESVEDVKITLFVTLCLVVMVIFLFLRNLSATVIPSLALPISIIGTFGAMHLLDYSLDNLSLMALTLCVGFVVDDAIVMLENIVRHMEMGKPPFQAALDGAREIGFTIVSMTLSLAAVFIPVLFMGGIVGRLFQEFAVTIGIAIIISGIVSLTLTPMLASRFLRPSREAHHGRIYEATERAYQRSLRFYVRTLDWVMRHRRAALAFSAAILVGTVLLFRWVPKGFIPTEDTGMIFGNTEMAEGTSFEEMVAHQQEVAAIVQRNPHVAHVMSSIGGGGGGGGAVNQGRINVRLKERGHRPPAGEIARELTRATGAVPGIRTFLQVPPIIRLGGRPSKTLYQFTLQGGDTDALYESAARLEARLRDIDILRDVTSDLQIRNPELGVDIDRDRAASLGLTVEQIERGLYDAYGTREVSTILTPNNQYPVILDLLPAYQREAGALELLHVRSSDGTLVPLSAVVTTAQRVGPLSVNHSGQLPSVTLSFNLAPDVALGDAVREVERAARQTLPETISTGFSGTAQAFQASQAGLNVLLLLTVIVIYIVLGILYESFIHPLTILSGVPFAGFGALLTLVVFRTELSIYAFVGIIMLVGLVKKNAIMMIDFALDAERNEGKGPAEAIVQACAVRFRPIMMTTVAALMGTLPIAVGWGAGAESRRPLGLAVVGGLFFSQLITLYVTPVFYTYLDALQRRLDRRAAARTRAAMGETVSAG